jgi:hypothetical protein
VLLLLQGCWCWGRHVYVCVTSKRVYQLHSN